MPKNELTQNIINVIQAIPKGMVSTYGRVAAMAGNPQAARRVVRVLKTYSKLENLPWHRVVNREGRISLKQGDGYEEQRYLLENEGIRLEPDGRIDLDRHLWTLSKGSGDT